MVERQEFFQLELFRFEQPAPRAFARNRRPHDIGYTMLGIHVADFEGAMEKLRLAGSGTIALAGGSGRRRAAVRDPDGVLLEVMEDDPQLPGVADRARPESPVAVRSVRASVPDLEMATRFFAGVLGLLPLPEPVIHNPADEALWGLPGARVKTIELAAGDVVVELVEYLEPLGRPWPVGYRISDHGLLNLAFGGRDQAAYEEVRDRVRAGGYPMNEEMTIDIGQVVYVEDGQGFSVELLHIRPGTERLAGFEPQTWDRPPR
jgi:catechol 2,3-dioxygenase-like lactoylglutathione lyase family enzyme